MHQVFEELDSEERERIELARMFSRTPEYRVFQERLHQRIQQAEKDLLEKHDGKLTPELVSEVTHEKIKISTEERNLYGDSMQSMGRVLDDEDKALLYQNAHPQDLYRTRMKIAKYNWLMKKRKVDLEYYEQNPTAKLSLGETMRERLWRRKNKNKTKNESVYQFVS